MKWLFHSLFSDDMANDPFVLQWVACFICFSIWWDSTVVLWTGICDVRFVLILRWGLADAICGALYLLPLQCCKWVVFLSTCRNEAGCCVFFLVQAALTCIGRGCNGPAAPVRSLSITMRCLFHFVCSCVASERQFIERRPGQRQCNQARHSIDRSINRLTNWFHPPCFHSAKQPNQ